MLALITRAAAEAERSAARLRARGIDCLISPLLRMVDVAADIPARDFAAIVLTSARAAQSQAVQRLPAPLKALPLWVVGEKTCDAARAAGLSGPALTAPDAATLAAGIGKLGTAGPALYLAGADRKPDLERELARLHIGLCACVVYEAQALDGLSEAAQQALSAGRIDAVLHYSRRSADLYAKAASSAGVPLDAARHVCLSEDVAGALRALGATRIAVAAAPTESALFDALVA